MQALEARERFHLVIEPGRRSFREELADLLHYRDLSYFLVRRELKVRYHQTLLGVMWVVIQPLMSMVVFSIFLGKLASVPSDGLPYPVFAYLGLLPWSYFSATVSRCAGALVGNASLLGKVYFPRVLILVSSAIAGLVDFSIAGTVLVGLLLFYGMTPSASIVLYLPLTFLTALIALGLGMWLATINVQFRDVQHATPFLLQLLLFATPIVYPASLVPDRYQLIYRLNPMAGVIEAYRAAALGTAVPWSSLALSALVASVLIVSGWWKFRRMERHFADIV